MRFLEYVLDHGRGSDHGRTPEEANPARPPPRTKLSSPSPRLTAVQVFVSRFFTVFFFRLLSDPGAGEPTAGQRANNYIEELSLSPGVERTLRVRYCAASPAPASAGTVGPDDDDDDDGALATTSANVGVGGGGRKASARSLAGQ